MRAGALPEPSPALSRADTADSFGAVGFDAAAPVGVAAADGATGPVVPTVHDDRAARVARLELVRPGIRTAAALAHERTLPLVDALHDLVPSGVLQRGSTLATHGAGATSFALGLVAEAVRAGSFLAIVAPSTFNLASCLDFDIPLRRVVQFVLPDADVGGWPQQVAAVIEGFDLVVLADRRRAGASQARQLTARTRERGAVVVRAGGRSWPEAPDLRFDLHEPVWHGLGDGHGHLSSRVVSVQVAGRRWRGAPRVRHLRLSGDGIAPIEAPRLLVPRRVAGRGGELPARVVADGARFAGADIDELVRASDRARLDQAAQGDRADRAAQAAQAAQAARSTSPGHGSIDEGDVASEAEAEARRAGFGTVA